MDITITSSVKEVQQYLDATKAPVIADIETTALTVGHGHIICMAFAPYDQEDVLVWWPSSLDDIAQLVLKRGVFHNAPFDQRWLRSYGAKVRVVWDTMLMAHLLDENNRVGLKDIGQRLLGYDDWTEDEVANLGEFLDPATVSPKELKKRKQRISVYVAKDVHVGRDLMRWQRKHIRRNLKPGEDPVRVMKDILLPAIEPLAQMEKNQLPVRLGMVKKELKRVSQAIQDIEKQLDASIPDKDKRCDECRGKGYRGRSLESGHACEACAGKGEVRLWPDFVKTVNWGNTNWTKWWLFVHQGALCPARGKPTKTWPEGAPSLAAENLSKIDHPAAKLLSDRSTLYKNLTGFLVPISERTVQGRVPTSFKLTGTVTGRLSSASPSSETPGLNSQQIPRDKATRNLFGEKGRAWIEGDFSQLELRVIARMANERTMINLFEAGQDIHTYMAERLLRGKEMTKEARSLAKGVNFGFVYGMHAKHFADYVFENYGVLITPKEAQAFREEYFTTFGDLPAWYRKQRSFAIEHGGVPNAFGRFRHLPRVYHEDYWVQENAFRQAINAPVQSTGSDFMLISLSRLARDLRLPQLGAKLITTVHDSVCVTAPYATARKVSRILKETMEKADDGLTQKFFLKADVTISRCWGGEPLAEY